MAGGKEKSAGFGGQWIAGAAQDVVLAAAKADPAVQPHLAGKTIRKEIVVPGKLVNIVVG